MPANQNDILELMFSVFRSEKFIAAIFGTVGGAIATFVAPWTKWHFKEKELKREERKEKIHLWRQELSQVKSYGEFYNTPLYNNLVCFIPEDERKTLFSNSAIELNMSGAAVVATDVNSRILARFHRVIDQKEKEWNLI
jgi:hypothetical protein